MRRYFSITLSVCCALSIAAVALAKQSADVGYTYDTVWSTAVRFIRVDRQYPIRDRDQEAGYILFDYQEGGKTVPGSLELVRVNEGKEVRMSVQIPQMPSYVERMLLDGLRKKLTNEYGEPPKVSGAKKDQDKSQDKSKDRDKDSGGKGDKDQKSEKDAPKDAPSGRDDKK